MWRVIGVDLGDATPMGLGIIWAVTRGSPAILVNPGLSDEIPLGWAAVSILPLCSCGNGSNRELCRPFAELGAFSPKPRGGRGVFIESFRSVRTRIQPAGQRAQR